MLKRLLVVAGVSCMVFPQWAVATETANPMAMSKTLIVLKLDADKPIAVRTRFEQSPPTIVLEFPSQQVIGSLPEHSNIGKGIIRSITTSYGTGDAGKARYIDSLRLALNGSYAYRVQPEPGRIIVEIDHPASVSGTEVEVGLKGGTIIGGLGAGNVSERFLAIQAALAEAAPTPWTWQVTGKGAPFSAASVRSPQNSRGSTTQTVPPIGPLRRASRGPASAWPLFAAGLLVIGVMGLWWLASQPGAWNRLLALSASRSRRASSTVMLIDQLVWRAFEQQGYELVTELGAGQPPGGVLRILVKDGSKIALRCVGNGTFLEKQTVERFLQQMREARVEQGVLVAAGSFTVPAQRLAKEHRVSLIGRDQLSELLSAGATSEYVKRQLEQHQARLEEAKTTLQQYAEELETLRRQRNEASWYLGEERARAAQRETQLAELSQQLRHHETELQRWEQEAATLRKQWEESQWYLGEARTRIRHVEGQFVQLQEIAKDVQAAQRERDEATRQHAEELEKRTTLEASLAKLQDALEASKAREQASRESLAQFQANFQSFQGRWGGRRSSPRVSIPEAFVEIHDGENGPIFAGSPRDVSATGLGLDSKRKFPIGTPLRVHLTIPGSSEPIESQAKITWQRARNGSPRYQSGFQLSDLSDLSRTRVEEAVSKFQNPSS